MLFWKIVLSSLLFLTAILPVFIKSDSVYQNTVVKILMTVFLLFILIASIRITIIEEKEKETEKTERKNEKIEREKNEKENKESIKLNSELDNFINNIEIKLSLNDTYAFKNLNPIYFGYEFWVSNTNINIKEVLISNDELKRNNTLMLSYKIYDAKRGGSNIISSSYGRLNVSEINNLYTQIHFPENTYTFRELNKGMLMIYLKENLIDKVTNISLEINGWVLINENISVNNWEKIDDISKVIGWENYGLDNKTYYRISANYTQSFNYHPWQIDLFNREIKKRK